MVKSILPFIIIIHHIHYLNYSGLGLFGLLGEVAMYIFFAMSGYGLVYSYIYKDGYLDGFVVKTFKKLFLPYFVALVALTVYRSANGISQIVVFEEKGLFGLVPTSWFIFVLYGFYLGFYCVFRYVRASIAVKLTVVSLLVITYCILAQHLGLPRWQYFRCPAFCIGLFIAPCAKYIVNRIPLWLIWATIVLIICGKRFFFTYELIQPYYIATLFFLLMFAIPCFRSNLVIRLISNISLEMYIIQFLAIYIVMDNMGVTSTAPMLACTLVLDMMFAYFMHKIDFHFIKERICRMQFLSLK